mmetsp:Transcript_16120/g.42387  ORF Transcript_16120/g.42387 Transcript_16120/m.42387 type:complete len:82 (-) Transcript_16120:68-313(-)
MGRHGVFFSAMIPHNQHLQIKAAKQIVALCSTEAVGSSKSESEGSYFFPLAPPPCLCSFVPNFHAQKPPKLMNCGLSNSGI